VKDGHGLKLLFALKQKDLAPAPGIKHEHALVKNQSQLADFFAGQNVLMGKL
jgi:hypothetical protein